MIRVTVELVPLGDETSARRRVLGVMEIANDGTGTSEIGNYDGVLHAEYTDEQGRRGRIVSFRRQRQSVWSLVGAFLKLWGHTKHGSKKSRGKTMARLDEKGRCCGRKPVEYKRPNRFFCTRCNREYDSEGQQVANWAWLETSPGKFKEKRYQDIDTEELLNVEGEADEDSEE